MQEVYVRQYLTWTSKRHYSEITVSLNYAQHRISGGDNCRKKKIGQNTCFVVLHQGSFLEDDTVFAGDGSSSVGREGRRG